MSYRDSIELKQLSWFSHVGVEGFSERRFTKWFFFALLASVFLHVLAWELVLEDWLIRRELPSSVVEPMLLVYEPPVKEIEFVEANPNVPENEPDDTPLESSRSQQAAEEVPDLLSQSNRPSLEEGDLLAHKVVSGEMVPEVEHERLPPGLYVKDSANGTDDSGERHLNESAVKPVRVGAPDPPDFIEQEPESEAGNASAMEENERTEEANPEVDLKVIHLNQGELYAVESEAVSALAMKEAARKGVPLPKARPKIKFKVPPGPVRKHTARASRTGIVSVDARFSEFGEYAQRLVEAVSEQWHLLANRTKLADGNIGTRVELVFILDKEGQVHEVVVSHSNATKAATYLCQDALMSRAPYGPWPAAMVAVHGDRKEITFNFHYR